MNPAILMDRVSFSYNSRPILQNIDLQIPRQSILGLIGPNGSGKTTLLKLISRILHPQQGQILIDGQPLDGLRAGEIARKMAVISSEQSFEFPFAVKDIVAMGRFPHLRRWQKLSAQDQSLIDESMRMTAIGHLQDRPISKLSSGERQRVLIARAITQEPSLLLLDEPNAHLDINHQLTVFHLLHRLNREKGMTILVVLHDLTAAAAFCHAIVLLHERRIVKEGRPEDVITAELIRQTYGAEVDVYPNPRGGFPQISFLPLRSTD
ncbi:MAG: ABC transporter ATP-binding protein [Terriglobia bacterium]